MHAHRSDTPRLPLAMRQQIEGELLLELRHAEAEFKGATSDLRPAAEERFRQALRRFSDLILEGRVPPDLETKH